MRDKEINNIVPGIARIYKAVVIINIYLYLNLYIRGLVKLIEL